jgi:outer membrane protein, multidrug efflux system
MFQLLKPLRRPGRVLLPQSLLPAALILLVLSGCAVKPTPLTMEERKRQVFQDMAVHFSRKTPPSKPITIHDAMAHAIRFNLGHRVDTMKQVLARGMTKVASQQMLPSLAADAGYTSQNKLTSSEQFENKTGSLGVSWNVLDLGVSYISAKQQSDRIFIASELKRKATHNLIRDVRSTFWKAVAAERLEKAIVPLKIKLANALESSRQAEKEQIEPPKEALNDQVSLLETLQKLQRLQKQVASSKIKLAELMGMDPSKPFTLAEEKEGNPINLEQLPPIEALEGYALLHRPELWEKDYKRRIKAYETKKTILRLFPGIDFSQSNEYDNTETYTNNIWSEFGISLTWNLVSLLTAPETISLSRDKVMMEDMSRLALNMSVMVQVHVALRNLVESLAAYEIASQLSEAKEKLYTHAQAEQEAETVEEMDLISSEGGRILYLSHRDLAFAKLQNAAGTFLVSLGLDVLPGQMDGLQYEAMAARIEESNILIKSGVIPGFSKELIEQYQRPKKKKKKQNKQDLQQDDPDLDTPSWTIETVQTEDASTENELAASPPPKAHPKARHKMLTLTPIPPLQHKVLELPPLQHKVQELPPVQYRMLEWTPVPPLRTSAINLDSAVISTHLTQSIDSPDKTEEDLITDKVTATSPVSPDKSIDYAMHALPTTEPRIKAERALATSIIVKPRNPVSGHEAVL